MVKSWNDQMTILVALIGIYYAYLIILYEVPKLNITFIPFSKSNGSSKKPSMTILGSPSHKRHRFFPYLNHHLREERMRYHYFLSNRVHERKYCVCTSFHKIVKFKKIYLFPNEFNQSLNK